MSSRTLTDGIGRAVHLPGDPQRIVSLVPSTTETLFALGLGERVVGVTRYCVHPVGELDRIVKIGGTKQLERQRLVELEPDLVIGNAEENTREMLAWLEARWPTWMALPKTVDEGVADLRAMGALLGVEQAADAAADEVLAARQALHAARPQAPWTYAYLIWRKPWMAVSEDTFIAAMLAEAGGVNALGPATDEGAGRYPTVELERLAAEDLDRVLLSSEPFPFKDKHIEELVAAGVSREKLALVDGELCSWHGVRMGRAFRTWAAAGGL